MTTVSYRQLCREEEAAAKPTEERATDGAPGERDVDMEEPPTGAVADDGEGSLEGESGEEEDGDDEEGADEEGGGGSGREGGSDDDESEPSYDGELGHGYDVNDTFIDDSEILETPLDLAGKAKHTGFFINKGLIEREGGQAIQPEMRRRLELSGHAEHDADQGGVKKTAAPRRRQDCKALASDAALASAVEELRSVVIKAPPPPEDQKRRALTAEMAEMLDKMKLIVAKYPEMPRGLTGVLLDFIAPFASKDTLRRRLQGDAPPGARPDTIVGDPTAAAAVATQSPTAPQASAPPRAAAALGPPPTQDEINRGMETLRTRVQARCASLNPGAEGGDDFRHNFKWDRDCEEALYTVVINSQRMDKGHKNIYNNLVASNIFPKSIDAKELKEDLKKTYSRVHKRKTARAATKPAAGAAPSPLIVAQMPLQS